MHMTEYQTWYIVCCKCMLLCSDVMHGWFLSVVVFIWFGCYVSLCFVWKECYTKHTIISVGCGSHCVCVCVSLCVCM